MNQPTKILRKVGLQIYKERLSWDEAKRKNESEGWLNNRPEGSVRLASDDLVTAYYEWAYNTEPSPSYGFFKDSRVAHFILAVACIVMALYTFSGTFELPKEFGYVFIALFFYFIYRFRSLKRTANPYKASGSQEVNKSVNE